MDINLETAEGVEEYKGVLIERINNGNALEFLVNCEGWEILINSLQQKKQEQIDILMETPPGNDADTLKLHAIAFAVAHTVDDVSTSVQAAIQDGHSARIALAELNNQSNEQEENWS